MEVRDLRQGDLEQLTRGARPYALVENVVTKATARRAGLGAAVLRALLEGCWAESVGFDGRSKQASIIQAP